MKLILKILKWYLESQIKDEYDPVLSRKLDCVIYLLESDEVRPNGTERSNQ